MADFPFALTPTSPTVPTGSASTEAPTFEPFADNIGFGILSPFKRGASDFVSGGGTEFVQSMITEVLGTVASSDFSHGELPWRPEFGSLLHFLRHKPNNALTAELARVYVTEALAKWVPQVRLKAVDTERKNGPNGEPSILLIRLKYDIIGQSMPGNAVRVSDVDQSITLTA